MAAVADSANRFIRCFTSRAKAVEFEDSVLSIGRNLLPECARQVLDGGEATPAYWDFLVEQTGKP